MSEMQRWLDSDEVDGDVRELLGAAAVPRSMTAAERARSARSLGRIAALPAAAGAMFWIKNVALAGILGATGGLVVSVAAVLAEEPRPASAPARAPAPIAPIAAPARPAHTPESAATSSAAEPAPRPMRAPVALPESSAEPSAPDSLALETAKLERARRALGTDPGRAFELLSEHAREFPSGKLGAERELLTIDALIRLGRSDEARTRARAMLERSRGGLYEQRLEKMLGTLP